MKLCLTVQVSATQLLNTTVCSGTVSTLTWYIVLMVVQFILSIIMCILVVANFMRNSLQMHQVTGTWQFNKYLSLLVRDGILYFLVYTPLSPSFSYRHGELITCDYQYLLLQYGQYIGQLG